jgi:sporulation protein YabP
MEKECLPHKLSLDGRSRLGVTGVTDVLSFDEGAVLLRTEMGILTVQGRELRLKTLSPEGGQVTVEGTVSSLVYEEPRSKGGWLSRLMG